MLTLTTRTVLIALVAFAAAATAAPALNLKLSGADKVDGIDNLKILTTVTNTGDESLKLLIDPRGPLDNLPTDTFIISHDETGAAPVFTGVLVKYTPTDAAKYGSEDSYTVITPGQSFSLEHDLSAAYNFTASGAGRYSISAVNRFYYLDETNTPVEVFAAHPDAHVISISGKLAVTPTTKAKRATFVGCTTVQQAQLYAAALAAQNYASTSVSYASSLIGSTPRYVEWFGTFTTARLSTVLTILRNVNTNDFLSYQYDCSCTRTGVFAYVNANVFAVVNLCPLFWISPLTGTDSQGGTLLHESTHFKANGGTQDYADGPAAALALAIQNPGQATNNADNFEYFAENNPPLA